MAYFKVTYKNNFYNCEEEYIITAENDTEASAIAEEELSSVYGFADPDDRFLDDDYTEDDYYENIGYSIEEITEKEIEDEGFTEFDFII